MKISIPLVLNLKHQEYRTLQSSEHNTNEFENSILIKREIALIDGNVKTEIDLRIALNDTIVNNGLIDFLPKEQDPNWKCEHKVIIYILNKKNTQINKTNNSLEKKYLAGFLSVKHYFLPINNYTELLVKHSNNISISYQKDEKLPKVSIIIPTYNAQQYIEQSLQSAIWQKYSNKEVIIVDGGSSDKTLEIVSKYKHSIDVIISETDRGIFDAINKGTLASNGKYSIFLGADDILLPNALSSFYQEYSDSNSKDFYFGDYLVLNNEKYEIQSTFIKSKKFGKHNIGHPALFISKKAFLNLNGFDLSYNVCSDADFKLKLISDGYSYKKLNSILTIYRSGGYSSLNLKKIKEAFIIFNSYQATNIQFYVQNIKYIIFHYLKKLKVI